MESFDDDCSRVMLLTILSVGTRGDLEPLIALGLGLERAGHQVRVGTHPKLEPYVRRMGLEFAPVAEGAVSAASTREGRAWERTRGRVPIGVGLVVDARSVASRRLADAVHAGEGCDAIVVSDLATFPGWQVAEHLGVPLIRTKHIPPGLLRGRMGGPIARATRKGLWRAARPMVSSSRRAAGLPPGSSGEPIAAMELNRSPILYCWSPTVLPPPVPRAAAWSHVTGYCFLDQSLDPDPPPGLIQFLEAGPPPVCVAYGSMFSHERARNLSLTVEALRRAGQRAVLVRGRSTLLGAELPDTVFAVETIGYQWLLPHCVAVIHHGGTGTIASTIRAGLPSVPVPAMRFQREWAEQMHALGVGMAPILSHRLTVEALHAAISIVTSDAAIRSRAASMGERIRAEDGVGRAVEVIEEQLGSEPRSRGPVAAGSARGVDREGRRRDPVRRRGE